MRRMAVGGAQRGPVCGTLAARAVTGSIVADPDEGRTVRFGRDSGAVDLCIGGDDDQVSRQHGLLVCRRGTWWLSNTGRGPIELPQSRWLRPNEDPLPLGAGYTTMFVLGSRNRDHLLELYVSQAAADQPPMRHRAVTRPGQMWELSPGERLVLVALGQRYLYNESNPQPLTRLQVAELINELRHDEKWTEKRVERVIEKVRRRLSGKGVYGLLRDEVGEPIGNSLSDNLLRELIRSMTLGPSDLHLLEPPESR